MDDNELRDRFSQWAQPLRAAAPPPMPVIRRRARRRMARIAASAMTAVAILAVGAVQATDVLGAANRRPPAHSPTATRPARPGSVYSAAPFYIAASSGGSSAGVWDAATGKRLARIAAPAETSAIGRYPTIWAYIAAAGDDRTFVLAAVANTNSEKASPVWLFRVRLGANGMPGRLTPLRFTHEQQGVVRHWYQNISSIALSGDGTRLAIATNRAWADSNGPADIEVVNLATKATRIWTSTPQQISSLSWAGDTKIAFACNGICLLDTRAPGSSLNGARVVVRWATRYRGMQGLQWPRITPDGSKVYVAMETSGTDLGLVEFSVGTGRPLRVVIGPQATFGSFCGTLWSDPAGRHLTAACTWASLSGRITDGRFTRGPNLPPANPESNSSGAGGLVIGW